MFSCITVKRNNTMCINNNIIDIYNTTKKRKYEFNDNIIVKQCFSKGHIHRQDGPAIITYNRNYIVTADWLKHGVVHNIKNPARICYYYGHGGLETEEWYENGNMHRLDGPAQMWYDYNGIIHAETWCKDGKTQRTDKNKPSVIFYTCDGNISCEEWFENGLLSRKEKPAAIVYDDNGKIILKKWYKNGKQQNNCSIQ